MVLPTPGVPQNMIFTAFSINRSVIRSMILDLSSDGWKLKSNSLISFKNGKLATFTQSVIACCFLKSISLSVSSHKASRAVFSPSAIISRYVSIFSLNLNNSSSSRLFIKLLYVFINPPCLYRTVIQWLWKHSYLVYENLWEVLFL